MRKKIYGVKWTPVMGCIVFAAVLVLWLGGNATAAVTTISDGFTDDSSGSRDNGDPLNGVITEAGAAEWDAEDVKFVQPAGVVANSILITTTDGIGAFAPINGNSFPVGTKYSVKVDAKFQQTEGVDTPVNYVQVGFIASDALYNSFNPAGSLHVIVYANGNLDLKYSNVIIADQTHANFNAFTLDLDAFNTIELVYHENLDAVQVFVNGTNVFVPRMTPGQNIPTIGKAGFRCDLQLQGGGDVPIGQVEFDNFEVTADDSTALSIVEGPVSWGGHTYYLLSPGGWAAAQRKAEWLGGNLITIETQAENDWLYSQWGNYDISGLGIPPCGTAGETCLLCDFGTAGLMDAMWIGYHQPEPVDPGDEPAGAWEWISGSSATYTNWHTGHPNNSVGCPTSGSEANAALMPNEQFTTPGGGPWFSWTSYATVASMGVVEVDGLPLSNNGFRMDWVYCAQRADDPTGSALNPERGSMRAYHEDTGELMTPGPDYFLPGGDDDGGPPGAGWVTLTFSGTSANNDARMFVAKEIPVDSDYPTDVEIAEIDSYGNTVKSVNLSTLLGGPSPGSRITIGAIRYSSFHGTLFLSINPDWTTATSNAAMIYELDLGLTTVQNTYTGPVCWGNGPRIDIDPANGTIYLTSQSMGRVSHDLLGNVYAIDTATPPHTPWMIVDGGTITDWSGPNVL
ncbi:MAG: hypothetical protein JSV03_01320, partial [Planctomycetota bacterium]